MNRWGTVVLSLVILGCGGSSAKRAPQKPEPVEEAGPPVSLAVLPVGTSRFTRLGAALDQALQSAKVSGASPRVSSVALDVVQLSIECTEAAPPCYAAVAKSLKTEQILFARVQPQGAAGVYVEVLRTDAQGATVKFADATYASEDEGVADAEKLVGRATR